MDMVPAEHGQRRSGRLLPPRKQARFFAARGFFPLGFGRKPFPLRTAEIRCFGPRHVKRGPARQRIRRQGVDGHDVLDELVDLGGNRLAPLCQPPEEFAETHFVPVDVVAVEPDAPLGLFGIVVLQRQAERFMAGARGPHQEESLRHRHHGAAFGSCGDGINAAVCVRRCCKRGRRRRPERKQRAEGRRDEMLNGR
jgi:hypothetical protein